jgi:uncharacterized protein HemY
MIRRENVGNLRSDLLLSLGRAYLEVGRFKEARGELEAVVKKDPVGASGRRAAELLKNVPQ